jgi:AcrR family transcriptional regulator
MQRRSTETRKKILTTSYALFSHQGYEATGVAQICEGAEISKGAFYHHFPSKKHVLFTLIEEWVANIQTQFQLIREDQTPIPDQFSEMLPALSTVFLEADQIPLFLEFWLQSMRDPEIAYRLIKPYYTFVTLFEKMFEKGISEGSINADSDPHMSMRLMLSFSLGLIMQAMIEPNREDWKEIAHFSLEKVMKGLSKE